MPLACAVSAFDCVGMKVPFLQRKIAQGATRRLRAYNEWVLPGGESVCGAREPKNRLVFDFEIRAISFQDGVVFYYIQEVDLMTLPRRSK